jgi:hypothetical protein
MDAKMAVPALNLVYASVNLDIQDWHVKIYQNVSYFMRRKG